jgi:hypothetical protein
MAVRIGNAETPSFCVEPRGSLSLVNVTEVD